MKTWLVSFCLVLFAGMTSLSAEPIVQIPAAEKILSTLKPSHPRLVVSVEDLQRLRESVKTNAIQRGWYENIQQRAQQLLTQPPSTYEIPDGVRLLATSRKVMMRIYDLALVYQISGDARFAKRAWAELEAAGNFKDWNPRHFLDTAEMTHAFAIGYDWLYDYCTPEQRNFIRTAIVEKGLKLGIETYRQKKGWWTTTANNWNQVCNGGLGMGALAIADEEPALAGEFLYNALQSLQIPMPRFAPDGAWDEGPGYWNYATLYNVFFLAGLQSALGTDFGLGNIPGFSEAGFFPIHLSSEAGHVFNFADGGDHIPRPAQLFWMARRFNRPEFAAFALQASEPTTHSLIWFDPQMSGGTLNQLPLDKYFRTVEVATFRTAWGRKDGTYVGFKAGKNGISHSHLDLGTFVFDALGQRWALDQGADNYNLPGFFGGKRWTYYRLRAEGHNTLVLNPGLEPDQAPKAETRIVRFESKPDRAFAVADLTPAYAKDAKKVCRGIALLQRQDVLIQDEVQAEKPADLWWFMHTPAEIKLDGSSATLKLGSSQISARILSPAGATFTVMKAEPLSTSPHPEGQASNHISKLAIHLQNVKDLRLTVLLSPSASKGISVTPLQKW